LKHRLAKNFDIKKDGNILAATAITAALMFLFYYSDILFSENALFEHDCAKIIPLYLMLLRKYKNIYTIENGFYIKPNTGRLDINCNK